MAINPRGIDGANARACDRHNVESPVLTVGGEQLHRLADASLKQVRQARTDNDRTGVISKVIKVTVNQLVQNIGGLCMQGRIDTVKIYRRVLKSRASGDGSAQDR